MPGSDERIGVVDTGSDARFLQERKRLITSCQANHVEMPDIDVAGHGLRKSHAW